MLLFSRALYVSLWVCIYISACLFSLFISHHQISRFNWILNIYPWMSKSSHPWPYTSNKPAHHPRDNPYFHGGSKISHLWPHYMFINMIITIVINSTNNNIDSNTYYLITWYFMSLPLPYYSLELPQRQGSLSKLISVSPVFDTE